MEVADVRFVLLDRFGLARLFMDLHGAVEARWVVAVRCGRRTRGGEDQESQTSDEGQDP
jgi:hypothetical protein